jgi:hypothetical protein
LGPGDGLRRAGRAEEDRKLDEHQPCTVVWEYAVRHLECLTLCTAYHTALEVRGRAVPFPMDQNTSSSSTVTLDGTLNVFLISGFVPVPGDSFQILTSGMGVNGTFAAVNADPIFQSPVYNPMDVTLLV